MKFPFLWQPYMIKVMLRKVISSIVLYISTRVKLSTKYTVHSCEWAACTTKPAPLLIVKVIKPNFSSETPQRTLQGVYEFTKKHVFFSFVHWLLKLVVTWSKSHLTNLETMTRVVEILVPSIIIYIFFLHIVKYSKLLSQKSFLS